MNATARGLAVVTGSSSGIGLELARECVGHGFDLLLAADRPMKEIQLELESLGVRVETVEADLATRTVSRSF